MEIKKIKTVKATWLGVPGVSTTYHLDNKKYGFRVNVLKLTNAPYHVKLIEGNGRKANFQIHSSAELATEAEVQAFIAAI